MADDATAAGGGSTNVPAPDCFPQHMRTYNQDGLITMHDCSFMQDQRFAKAYAAAAATRSWVGPWGQAKIHWRAHVLCWAGERALEVEGDFVECGVDRGGTAMLLLTFLGLHGSEARKFHLYDTFRGLDSRESSANELSRLAGIYAECFDQVKATFSGSANVVIHRGPVPDTLDDSAPRTVAFMHIDMNAARPERQAMEFFWDRLSPGAVVVFDDYAWVACHAQKVMLDDFARLKQTSILSLPTGQGLMIKPFRSSRVEGDRQ